MICWIVDGIVGMIGRRGLNQRSPNRVCFGTYLPIEAITSHPASWRWLAELNILLVTRYFFPLFFEISEISAQSSA